MGQGLGRSIWGQGTGGCRSMLTAASLARSKAWVTLSYHLLAGPSDI